MAASVAFKQGRVSCLGQGVGINEITNRFRTMTAKLYKDQLDKRAQIGSPTGSQAVSVIFQQNPSIQHMKKDPAATASPSPSSAAPPTQPSPLPKPAASLLVPAAPERKEPQIILFNNTTRPAPSAFAPSQFSQPSYLRSTFATSSRIVDLPLNSQATAPVAQPQHQQPTESQSPLQEEPSAATVVEPSPVTPPAVATAEASAPIEKPQPQVSQIPKSVPKEDVKKAQDLGPGLRQVEQTAPQTREVLKKVEDDDLFAAFM